MSNPFGADRRCDCWVCRYSVEPMTVDECYHPHLPHRGTEQQERAKQNYRHIRDALKAERADREQTQSGGHDGT